MVHGLADKIRGMAQFCDEEAISKAIGLPVEIVKGVLSGEIEDQILEDYDPARPPDVRIVEQKRFIRSKTIGVISSGGTGASTITAALSFLSAKRMSYSVAAVDANECPFLYNYLGIDASAENIINFATMTDNTNNTQRLKETKHPDRDNLFTYLMSHTTAKYNKLKENQLSESLQKINEAYGLIWVDCPTSPRLWPGLLNTLDFVIYVVKQDLVGLNNFWQVLPIIKANNFEDRFSVVLNFDKEEGCLYSGECNRVIKDRLGMNALSVLPYDPNLKKDLLQGKIVKYYNSNKSGKSGFVKSCELILDDLFPDSRGERQGKTGLFGR